MVTVYDRPARRAPLVTDHGLPIIQVEDGLSVDNGNEKEETNHQYDGVA